MWLISALIALAATALGQTQAPVAATASAPAVKIDIPPLGPPDSQSPYASPRDAARHRFQSAMAQLPTHRDLKLAMREMAEAFVADPTYAPAAYNLGLLCAVAGKWQDAIGAMTESARLDPARFRPEVDPQLERLRLIATLEATADGQRARRYDEALHSLLKRWNDKAPADAAISLVRIGRIDPKRWEAPGLLAGLLGDSYNYEGSLQFLAIAATNSGEPEKKALFQKAIEAARRELQYSKAWRDAEEAALKGETGKAALNYEVAWKIMPARLDAGMAAASAFLLADDTSRAVAVLHRFRHGSDAAASKSAAAMLKELEEIEPSAKAAPGLDEEFFRDRGVAEPARITPLVPKVDQRRMEILMRPLPRMVLDADPVTLLEALSANRAADQLPPQLPSLPAARVSDERPWAEAQRMISDARAAKSAVPEPEQAARMSAAVGSGKTLRTVAIDTTPPGASIFLNEMTESVCTSPCDLKVRPGTYALTATLAGFESLTEEIRVGTAPVPLTLSFNPIRGKVFIDAPDSALLEINGRPLQVRAPVEIEVVPGLYRFAARSGDRGREQFVNVRPDARLRLPLAP